MHSAWDSLFRQRETIRPFTTISVHTIQTECWYTAPGTVCTPYRTIRPFAATSVGNFSPAMGARNQVGIGLSYRPAGLCSLATQYQTRFLELIPRPIAGLKFSTQCSHNPDRMLMQSAWERLCRHRETIRPFTTTSVHTIRIQDRNRFKVSMVNPH